MTPAFKFRNIYTSLTLIICLIFSHAICAQQDQFQFGSLDTRNGLSSNQINTIFKDEKGFVWFGTNAGLNRYDGYNFKVFRHKISDSISIADDFVNQINEAPDHNLFIFTRYAWNLFDPRTEKFKPHLENYLNSLGIKDGSFTSTIKDQQNNFWFAASGIGLYKYNSSSKKTIFYNASSTAFPIHSNMITSLVEDHTGCIWIAHTDGIIEKIDIASGKVVNRSNALQQFNNNQNLDYRLFADSDNDLWVYCRGVEKGIYYFKTSSGYAISINKESKGLYLNNNIITGFIQDHKGNIWVATDHGGVNVINKKNFTIRYLLNNEYDPKSLIQNSISSLYSDADGNIWLGTFKKGVSYFHENNLRFPLYKHNVANPNSLPYNDVNKFVEDKYGNLWIGTNGGGLLYYNRALGTYRQYVHNASSNSLSNNVIVTMYLDKENKLWLGTYFGGLDCFDGKTFIHYKHDEKNPNSVADNRVWEIFEDSQNQLWVGTFQEGIDIFDRKEHKFIHHKPGSGNTTRSGYISCIMEDNAGNIWIGTAWGVDVLNKKTGLFNHYGHLEDDKTTLSNSNILDILQDTRGLIWVATRDGLNLFNPEKNDFKVFRVSNGLPDNTIQSLIEDNQHNLWLGTPNGLCNAIVCGFKNQEVSLSFKTYDETDGLQGRQFNENAAFKTSKGDLIFGGANGFNIFSPQNIRENKVVPNLVLTDLQIFNKSVQIGEEYNGAIILPESITDIKSIALKYNQNVFTIEFAELSFINSDKIKYAYKLDGFSKEWLTTDNKNRKATFTNLDPGTYTLVVKASNEDGVWSKNPLALKIEILPPFWLTKLAFIIYALLFLSALAFGRKMILKRARLRFQIEQERQEAQRLHELDMMKIKFFTNVSHEFRTPLSLIITPVEKLIKQASQINEKKQFQLIYRNARRLLNLVNQLLDFRKLEEQELSLDKTPGDVISFIKDISHSFSDIAENKRIAFSYNSSQDHVFTTFDNDKLERILFNLLSNAFKFTPVGGAVNVLAEIIHVNQERGLQLRVIDTGIGISKDKQEKIFDRFFQNAIPGSMVNQGSGIGLAITKEFIKLHGGTIQVESEPDKGSCFTVWLPIPPIEEDKTLIITGEDDKEHEYNNDLSVQHQQPKNSRNKKRSVLLVEDNDDFRFYIKDNLRAYFNILEAPNGKVGWQKALAEHPDIIVCDISMPEMNGIDLCKKIKADSRTSFIPVILLTALTGEEQQIAGLQTGANDYMTKPFNFEILHSKIKNLLSQQESFKKTYQKQVQVQASEIITESADDKFIQQALAVIEKNISNPDFSVEEMSREMFMSRVALYKKLFNLSGKTPIEFIRSIRLQRAAQLLQKNEMTVAEVAYEVGFNNPKYFSKYFKMEYNILPSTFHSQNSRI